MSDKEPKSPFATKMQVKLRRSVLTHIAGIGKDMCDLVDLFAEEEYAREMAKLEGAQPQPPRVQPLEKGQKVPNDGQRL